MDAMTPAMTPRYVEIADYLRRLVAASRPGDRLPSEAELCERFGVSRMTVRQAVQVLANERLLVRRRGEGTFTAPRVVARLLGSPLSFTESMRRRGLRASSRMLHAGWIDPSPEDRAALRLPADSRAVVVERIRLADDLPMAIERVVAPPACAGILEDDLAGGSLHDAFERLGRIPTRAQARVSARPATDIERSLLGLGPDGVVLSERRTIDDQDGIPIEHTETLYAAERYEFEAVLERGDHAEVS
jgi:DNA-binding GntR family transcriptional regulator